MCTDLPCQGGGDLEKRDKLIPPSLSPVEANARMDNQAGACMLENGKEGDQPPSKQARLIRVSIAPVL